jgi:RHS repeat-associated protein
MSRAVPAIPFLISALVLTASAAFAESPSDECVIALNTSTSKALNITGSGSVNATGCGIVVDSNSSSALTLTGSGNVQTKYTDVVGGYSATGSGKFSPTPQTGSAAQSDPLTFLTPPSSASCDYTNFSVTGSSAATLNPGTYCNGISVTGSGNVTFNSGTYIVMGGGLKITGSGGVTGSGVTFFITQGLGYKYGPVSLTGSGNIKLTGPTSGPYYRMLLYQDPNLAAGLPASAVTGSSTMTVQGVLYFPGSEISYTGSGNEGNCLLLIANTINLTGSANMNLGTCGTSPLLPVSVSVAPTSATLYGGQTQQFSATVTNTSNTAVTWSISPAGTGTISAAGLYTAPTSISAKQTVTVTATSQENSTKSASATVTLMPPVAVSVSPRSASLYGGQTQQFSATVTNTSNTAVTWSLSSAGTGSISTAGLYTAPAAIATQQNVTITATSQADTTKTASSIVTLVPPIAVSVSPTVATLYGGQSQQFSATVTNTGNTAVTWSISPAGTGSISTGGIYTAPATIATQQNVTVTATSQANATKSASATVTLMPPVAVTVSPTNATLYASQTQQFSATVTNTSNTAVTWSISPAGTGSISTAGIYTAPATIATQQNVTVTATSQADGTKSASGTVTLMPPVALTISPTSATLYGGQTQQFSATVTNTSNTAVTWSISPAGTGTINSSGLYTAPATITALQTVTITATSQADATKSASATITLAGCTPNNFSYQRAITVNHTKVPNTDQPKFSVLINATDPMLASTANGGHVANAKGYDIVFTSDPACSNKLNFEIESWNGETGQLVAWVQIPVLSHSSDTLFFACYGNSSVTTDQSNRTGTWDSNYQEVLHLDENSGTTVFDSTANGNNGTKVSVSDPAPVSAGIIGGAQNFNGTSDFITLPPAMTGGLSVFSVSFWTQNTDSGSNGTYWNRPQFVGDSTAGAPSGDFGINTNTGDLGMWSGLNSAGDASLITSSIVNDNTWHYIAAVNDGSAIHLYLDGQDTHQTLPSGLPMDNYGWYLGAQHYYEGGADFFHQGVIDEFRFSNTARSADWIATEFNNQSAPAAFYTIYPESAQSILIGPSAVSLTGSGTQQFTPTVLGACNQNVSWSLNPSGAGSISASGLYTAPASIASDQTVTVTATSSADSAITGSAVISLVPPITIAVTPPAATLSSQQTQQFTATVSNTSNTAVAWSINPATAGSITPTGLYMAPDSITSQQNVTVTATSQADTTKSASATVTLSPSLVANDTLTLSPSSAGPDVANTPQTLTCLLNDVNGNPISGVNVQFAVTGVNAMAGSATTDATGKAAFTYIGNKVGTDTVQASYSGFVSNTSTVIWVTPVQITSESTISAQFFLSDGSGGFDTPPGTRPVFTQIFPVINFNPPAGTIPGNTSGVNVNSRPFTDVTTDLNGNFTGTIIAQGNNYQAGVGPMFTFQVVFSGSFTIASPGNVVFQFFDDDGFIFGVGGGASRVSGSFAYPPPNDLTPFGNLPVMGSYNEPTAPVGNTVVVNFPAAGTYPFEVDYSECCGGQLALTMASGQSNPTGIPPTGSLTLSPNASFSANTGTQQSFTILANDASGNPVANLGVALMVNGVNMQSVVGTTDSTGHVTLSYTGVNPGTDSIQAVATISGLDAFSNNLTISWSLPAGSSGSTSTPVNPPDQPVPSSGWLGSPANGAIVTGDVPITSTDNLASGTLSYSPASNTNEVIVLNTNATGSGQIGTFPATQLPNGAYWIQLDATDVYGNTMYSLAEVTVAGNNKPGRLTASATDLVVPAPGLPISIQRQYDTLNINKSQDFGYGWSLATTVDLEVSPTYDVTLTVAGKRRTFYFTPTQTFPFLFLGIPAYTPEPGFYGKLTTTGDNCGGLLVLSGGTWFCNFGYLDQLYTPTGYIYTDPNGTQYLIGPTGSLQSITDLNGNTLTVTASGITSTSGLNVPFQRDSTGRITQITDPSGNVYQYAYDSNGNLASVTYPGLTKSLSYTYDPTHRLTGGTDARGNPIPTTSYDANGRLSSVTDALGNTTSYAYSTNSQNNTSTTTITYPADANGNVGTAQMVYDSYGMLLSSTNPLGNTTTNTYNANHNLLSTTDPLGHMTSYTYDSNGNQTSITYPPTPGSTNTTVSTTYNQYGGPTQRTDQLGNVQNVTYDANYLPQLITDAVSGSPTVIESFRYNSNGTKQADAIGYDLTVAPNRATTYTYDANGNVISQTDPLGRVTSYTYDSLGRLLTATPPLPTQTTDPATITTAYKYDPLGNLIETDAPLGRATKYQYDGSGNKISETDPLGRTTTYQYDALNRLILTIYPTTPATSVSHTYDFRGNEITVTDQAGHVTQKQYDLAGQLISVTSGFGTANASTVTCTYYADGRKKSDTDPLGHTTTYNYDAAGRLTSVVGAAGNTVSYTYDDSSNRLSMSDPNQHTTQYAYDSRHRLRLTTYADSTTKSFNYDSANNLIQVTDQAGATVQYTFDNAGELQSVVQTNAPDPTHNSTLYGYDPEGDLTSWKDANGYTTQNAFDVLRELISETYPLGGASQTRTYDGAGNLLTMQDFNGKTTTYSYDPLNRLLTRTPDPTLPDVVERFTYTPTGKRASMTDASGTTTYTYDSVDRLSSKATPQGTLSYTYDPAGNVSSISSSNANGTSVAYAYDQLNRLITVVDNRLPAGQNTTSYTYDPASNLTAVTYPNGLQSILTYDALNRLNALNGGTASYTYTLGPAGNRLSTIEQTGRAVNWSYDGIYRLTNEAVANDPNSNNGAVAYGLDPVGNRLSISSTLATIPSGTFNYNANDWLSTETYDNNGNTLSSGGRTFAYDFQNRLKAMNGGAVSMLYDGDGNRISKTANGITTGYLVDDVNPTGLPQVLEALVNGAVQRTYTYGIDRISQNQLINGVWTASFYGYDGGGHVRRLTDIAGTQTDTYQYDAFGNIINSIGSTPNNYLYRGEQFDSDLGLYYLRARYYNPITGRFLTRDPQAGRIGKPATSHKYLYAAADPVNRRDPSGRDDLAEEAELSNVSVTFTEHVAAHLVGTGISQAEFEAIVTADAQQIIASGGLSVGSEFWAIVNVQGVPWIYRAFLVTDVLLSVGTAYPK